MWLDGIGFAPPLEDTTKSRVAGKVGYGVQPKGPSAQHSGMFGDGMGVSAFSEKKEPAYLYCQWATNKENQARAAGQWRLGAPAARVRLHDPEVLAGTDGRPRTGSTP